MRIFTPAIVIAGLVLPAAGKAAPHRLECPAQAPAAWGLPQPARLEQPAVLSQPAGQPIDDAAPPSLVPDESATRGGVLRNAWIMGDEPGWSHFVDCRYQGSKQVLRLKADGLKRCEQTVRPWPARKGAPAEVALTCD